MKFTLNKTLVRELSFGASNSIHSPAADEAGGQLFQKFEVSVRYAEDNLRGFAIVFAMTLNLAELEESMKIEFWAFFEADQEIDDAFKQGHFPKVNAPAIAYPYLRSFVTTFMVSAGYSPIYLPTVNFSAMESDRRSRSAE